MMTRRHFLGYNAGGLGTTALSSLLAREATARPTHHSAPAAKRVINICLVGGFSQIDSNGDGLLSRTEVDVAGVGETPTFAEIDLDDDGMLEPDKMSYRMARTADGTAPGGSSGPRGRNRGGNGGGNGGGKG